MIPTSRPDLLIAAAYLAILYAAGALGAHWLWARLGAAHPGALWAAPGAYALAQGGITVCEHH